MSQTFKDVQKLLTELKTFMRRVEAKDPSLTTRESTSFPYHTVHHLRSCAPAFINHSEALDLLLETAPQLEAYRGKGTQVINDGLPQIFQSILIEIQYGSVSTKKNDPTYSEEKQQLAFQKIVNSALPYARGNGKALRSRRAAELRKSYWDLLTAISEFHLIPEALQLAKTTALNEKTSLPERSGAIDYLLTHQGLLADQKGGKTDPEIDTIFATLRDKPPSRDILFQILNDGVNSGEIDEMSALFDLEDWDEENED